MRLVMNSFQVHVGSTLLCPTLCVSWTSFSIYVACLLWSYLNIFLLFTKTLQLLTV